MSTVVSTRSTSSRSPPFSGLARRAGLDRHEVRLRRRAARRLHRASGRAGHPLLHYADLEAQGKQITTIEATTDGSDEVGAIVHAAWVKHDVAQCGYCQSGQTMSATAFLKSLPRGKQPSATEIDSAMAGNICRCGTYARIRAAVADAARALA
jgi:[2Fe-2S] binding domain